MSTLSRLQALTVNDVPHIAVIGDVIFDEYVMCDVTGLSPEDETVIKAKFKSKFQGLGGAANVALNLVSLGAKVTLIGVIGNDERGSQLLEMLKEHNINPVLVKDCSRPTTRKTRFITANKRHIFRLDDEVSTPIDGKIETGFIAELGKKCSLVVVSDYAKGVITDNILNSLRLSGTDFVADPKKRKASDYWGAKLITPNLQEFKTLFRVKDDSEDLPTSFSKFRDSKPNTLVTLGENGATLLQQPSSYGFVDVRSFHAMKRANPVDCSGCGDSLIAGVALGLALKFPLSEACELGIASGSCAVDHLGAAAVSLDEVRRELKTKGEQGYANRSYTCKSN